ncbi:DUF4422 domain-containing protein [Streptococcus pantholopis]|uniref:Exopolysaccharide biosynthesis protein n=1 Tax=Streptococcus pantholopis TaxID=1811193 RepID=A0A172Q7I8_9STRE|nr:DUF4422 domain-containing protein [Streptococcus pantholopis]AND79463.1 exopolysaccharide biosynthesis protein [Streptococcus pantholopis]
MKQIKILVATHKSFQMPADRELYLPLHVGRADKEDLGYQGDDTGDNISHLNPYYSELTGLYWAWKNLSYDYLGLVHYRRYFTARTRRYHEGLKIDEVVLSQEEVDYLLDESEIIVPKKRRYYIETLYSHYDHTLDGSHLDLTRQIISHLSPEYLLAFDQVMQQRSGYMFNMFIMKKEFVDDYLSWLFLILDELYQKIDISQLSAFEARLFGRVSELLFNVWLAKRQLTPREVPFIYLEKINHFQKGKAFLKAKFFGEKYGKSF